jgi:hypothetical protein
MERSSASVGLGNLPVPFRLCAGGRGGSFLSGFPSGEVARKVSPGRFPVVVRPLVVASSCEMVFTSPCGPQIAKIGSTHLLPHPLAFLSPCRVRARGPTVAALLGTVIEAMWQTDRHSFSTEPAPGFENSADLDIVGVHWQVRLGWTSINGRGFSLMNRL